MRAPSSLDLSVPVNNHANQSASRLTGVAIRSTAPLLMLWLLWSHYAWPYTERIFNLRSKRGGCCDSFIVYEACLRLRFTVRISLAFHLTSRSANLQLLSRTHEDGAFSLKRWQFFLEYWLPVLAKNMYFSHRL
jgi:hypothetical protein